MTLLNLPTPAATVDSRALPTLIMLARVPLLGQVKSRLARHIGRPQALRAHRQLLEHNARIALATGMPFELHVAGGSNWMTHFQRRLGVPVLPQASGDIGARMLSAASQVAQAGEAGDTASIVIGSDCGELSVDYLHSAASQLARAPVVLGPAEDGGYVLIGQREPYAHLFADIAWGSNLVAELTRQRAKEAGLEVAELALQWDVDGVTDWRRWRQSKDGGCR